MKKKLFNVGQATLFRYFEPVKRSESSKGDESLNLQVRGVLFQTLLGGKYSENGTDLRFWFVGMLP